MRATDLVTAVDPRVLSDAFVARPYAELFRHLLPEPIFFEADRGDGADIGGGLDWPVFTHPQLAWRDGEGPTYDQDEALRSIEQRYTRILPFLRHTVERLKGDARVWGWISGQHARGRPDWEILSVLMNIGLNARVSFDETAPRNESLARGLAAVDRAEAPEEALDPGVFTDEALALNSDGFRAAHLNGWRLRWPPLASPEGLERFLAERYRFGAFDVPHPDVFGWRTAST